MSLVRHEVQQYPTPAALAAETVVPTNNDEVHVESLNRRFNWLEGSSTTADNTYVIEQTSQSANGRWAATAVERAKVFTGTGATGAIPNGNTAVFTVTLSGAGTLAANSGAALGITNGSAFPASVFLDSIVLTADNTVQLTVANESGSDFEGFNVDVKAIDYTAVASSVTAKNYSIIQDMGSKRAVFYDGNGFAFETYLQPSANGLAALQFNTNWNIGDAAQLPIDGVSANNTNTPQWLALNGAISMANQPNIDVTSDVMFSLTSCQHSANNQQGYVDSTNLFKFYIGNANLDPATFIELSTTPILVHAGAYRLIRVLNTAEATNANIQNASAYGFVGITKV